MRASKRTMVIRRSDECLAVTAWEGKRRLCRPEAAWRYELSLEAIIDVPDITPVVALLFALFGYGYRCRVTR